MAKCSYTFPHRSRRAMVEYLLDRMGYYDQGAFPFNWNVKVYNFNYDNPEGRTNHFDAQWAQHVQDNPHVVEWAYESAREHYAEDWTSYPGADQGDWRFGFYGRSAGHLCLESWRGQRLGGRHDFSVAEWLQELSTDNLRAFYRGIRCADVDFTRDKAAQEVEAQLAFIREQWEDEQESELEDEARELESARPDMYVA